VAPIVFFNIGWMEKYAGIDPADPTIGGHRSLKGRSHGAEAFNFAPVAGKLYGYRPSGETRTDIDRLGAKKEPTIDGVTVVWIARRPKSTETMVVGWYKNATVYRSTQPLPAAAARQKRPIDEYMIEARAADCRLLPIGARTFQVRSWRKGAPGYGQSPTFYDATDVYRSRVSSYIEQIESNANSMRAGRSTRRRISGVDADRRREIEKCAIKHATAYFKSRYGGRWEVETVEADNKGWDLECFRGDKKLLVEVKGRGRSELWAELTPNEWSKMKDPEHQPDYVLYVVTDCLSENPVASIFRHDGAGVWMTEDGRMLNIERREAARVSFGF
jgi:hypothetical protein